MYPAACKFQTITISIGNLVSIPLGARFAEVVSDLPILGSLSRLFRFGPGLN